MKPSTDDGGLNCREAGAGIDAGDARPASAGSMQPEGCSPRAVDADSVLRHHEWLGLP
jgi:hypothetical protein